MIQTDLLTTVEHSFYRTAGSRTHQLVVYLQVTEPEWDIPQCVDVSRVEHGDTVSTAKYQTSVRQLTRSAIAKLVACQSVGLIE